MNSKKSSDANNNQILSGSLKNDHKQLSTKGYILNKFEQSSRNSPSSTDFSNSLLISASPNSDLLYPPSETFSTVSSTSPLQLQQQQQHLHHQQIQQQISPLGLTTVMNKSMAKRHFSGSNSSDDDEDDDENETGGHNGLGNESREEKRRISHTKAEQKRRTAIKRGYDELQSMVPSCEFMDPSSSQKVCKATVLKRSIDYIHEMEKEKDKHEQDIDSLKKEIMALKIMKSNYDEILQYHRNMPKENSVEINDETKFNLFSQFADNLFVSFQSIVTTNTNFGDLSSTLFNWIEQSCTSEKLKHMVLLSLFQIVQQLNSL